MFSNQHCILKTGAHKRTQHNDSYILKQIYDEERRVNDLKNQELLATAENPRLKTQKETMDICQELRECKQQDILEQKRRQQLRSNSQELRQLEAQLQAALVSKQLAEQKSYLAQQKEKDLIEKRIEDKKWAEECERARNELLQQEEQERQKKTQFRGMLQKQIGEFQQRRRMDFEDNIKDRDDMQKVVKRIQAEEQAERESADRFRARCKREMEECQRNRELQKQREKDQNVDETKQHLAYQQERDELNARMVAERKRLQMEKESLSEKIGQELAKTNNEKKKRESLLLSLLVEERKAKEDERYRQMLEKRVKERQQLRTELEKYRNEIKIRKERQLLEEERQMREEHMRYLADRDKLDQLSDEKRRRKIVEHNKTLREMIEIRRRQKVADIVERINDFENMMSNEKER